MSRAYAHGEAEDPRKLGCRRTVPVAHDEHMTTLHIEHAISDYATWKAAFDRFASARMTAGVLKHRIYQPVDDPKYVAIDLEFESAARAGAFLAFLRDQIWSSATSAPALVGTPQAAVLELVEEA
jgi:hypothetical protein